MRLLNASDYWSKVRFCVPLALKVVPLVYIKHYPSYASKWNPIEHRVFPHITRAISGVFIRSYEEFKKLVSRAKTKTGLKVTVNDIDAEYEAGARGKKEDWEGNVKFGPTLPKWNYSCTPVF